MSTIPTPAIATPPPPFNLPASTGKTISLNDYAGKKTIVLFFYPKADTPGCTTEACGFRDATTDYTKANAAVLGISPDPVEDVTKFSQKFHFDFPLLADTDHSIAEKYGVWVEKNMYGKKYWGVARTTFIIDKNCKIAHVFEKVKPEGHDKEVLTWLKENTK
jgi:peroxiredoxin Q/BCP